MKIAIPENQGVVNQHFGQRRSFAIIQIDGSQVQGVETISAEGLQHRHEGLADFRRVCVRENGMRPSR